jgi:hypothetical protein
VSADCCTRLGAISLAVGAEEEEEEEEGAGGVSD